MPPAPIINFADWGIWNGAIVTFFSITGLNLTVATGKADLVDTQELKNKVRSAKMKLNLILQWQ